MQLDIVLWPDPVLLAGEVDRQIRLRALVAGKAGGHLLRPRSRPLRGGEGHRPVGREDRQPGPWGEASEDDETVPGGGHVRVAPPVLLCRAEPVVPVGDDEIQAADDVGHRGVDGRIKLMDSVPFPGFHGHVHAGTPLPPLQQLNEPPPVLAHQKDQPQVRSRA